MESKRKNTDFSIYIFIHKFYTNHHKRENEYILMATNISKMNGNTYIYNTNIYINSGHI
uniref:Uncharacterized protein n=1 Tax=Meloidogyne enterolobii TaxID=390850 RepID=A0A6V7X1E3_MELEN|nr:unnamed protein product [Meloidogyne enterolobii]